MVNFYKPKSTEINAPTTVGTASTVSSARVVRAVNTSASTAYLVSYYDANFDDSASFTLAPMETVLIPKASGDKIYAANAAVKLSKITYPKG